MDNTQKTLSYDVQRKTRKNTQFYLAFQPFLYSLTHFRQNLKSQKTLILFNME